MKLAAPAQNFVAAPGFVQSSAPSENLDAGKKILYDIANSLSEEDKSLKATLDRAAVTNFSGDVLTLSFKSPNMTGMFEMSRQRFEELAAQVVGREIKVSVAVDENLPLPVFSKMSEPDRSNLAHAMNTFKASDATKIN